MPQTAARRFSAFAVLGLLALVSTLSAQAPTRRVVARDARVMLLPDVRRQPLTTLGIGTEVDVLSDDGEWSRIAFTDSRWGERVGFVHSALLRTVKPVPPRIVESTPQPPEPPRAVEPAPVPSRPGWWARFRSGLAELRERNRERYADWPAGVSPAVPSAGAWSQSPKVMLFGGRNQETYLGCLSCSEYASDSVFNEFGRHGSSYQTESIHNDFSAFGSTFSNYSPCNEFASDPPVIVDADGAFYGRLTINSSHPQRTRDDALQGFVAGLCAGR